MQRARRKRTKGKRRIEKSQGVRRKEKRTSKPPFYLHRIGSSRTLERRWKRKKKSESTMPLFNMRCISINQPSCKQKRKARLEKSKKLTAIGLISYYTLQRSSSLPNCKSRLLQELRRLVDQAQRESYFRRIALLVHPDKNSHPRATLAFTKLKQAIELTACL